MLSSEDTGSVLSTQRVDNNSLSLKFRESNTLFSFLLALRSIPMPREYTHIHKHTLYECIHKHLQEKLQYTE